MVIRSLNGTRKIKNGSLEFKDSVHFLNTILKNFKIIVKLPYILRICAWKHIFELGLSALVMIIWTRKKIGCDDSYTLLRQWSVDNKLLLILLRYRLQTK